MIKISKKDKLTKEQYAITQMCGTEPPFSGEYCNHYENGGYSCVCCDQPLFNSESGWPSFWEQVNSNAINMKEDASLGMVRTEITCAKCDSHLGHIFDDGPKPTGKRYCVNSLALIFKKAEK